MKMNSEYAKYYSEVSLWEKIRKFAKYAGAKVIYAVLLLYYAMGDKNVSVKSKLYISAALGYFILPTDALFDLTPIIGYSDDLGVLLFALKQLATCITPEVQQKARAKIKEWFELVEEKELKELEDKIF